MRIGLVGCGKGKRAEPAAARRLYTGALFRKASAYCVENYDAWYILSAKHGLLEPDTALAPYDLSLRMLTADERRAWGERVLGQIEERAFRDAAFFIHAGQRYAEHLETALRAERPLRGLGIGRRLAWYTGRGY